MPKKQEAKTETTDKATAAANAGAIKERATALQKFTFANEPSIKLPPQATNIVNILREAGKDGLTRADLVTAMEGVVQSKQPLSRILSYYQKALVESGACTIEAAPAAPVAEAPVAEATK